MAESNLVLHAQRELKAAGLYDADSDYGGMIGKAAEQIVAVFAEQGHSGFSAEITTAVVSKLMRFDPLTPLTNDPDEWMEVEGFGKLKAWQSRRNSSCFSNDGGRTYYDIDERPSRRRKIANFVLRRKGWNQNPQHVSALDGGTE